MRAVRCCAAILTLLATAACGGEVPAASPTEELPFVTNGPDELEEPGPRRFVINVTADGHLFFKSYEFDLASEDPGEQDDALQVLQDALRELHPPDPTIREKRGFPLPPILVLYRPGTPVKYLAWILQVVHHPDLIPTELCFVARGGAR